MHTRQRDREEVNNLYEVGTGVSMNHRDASRGGSSSSKQQAGGWQRNPTPVKAPRPGSLYTADSIRSDLKSNNRSYGTDRAPTLQSERTVLGMKAMRPGGEYPSGRQNKRQKVVKEVEYLAPSHPIRKSRNSNNASSPSTSQFFEGDSAGRGRNGVRGKAVFKGGGRGGPPGPKSRRMNLNADAREGGEAIVVDSDEERKEERRQERHTSKGATNEDATSDDEVIVVTDPPPHTRLSPSTHTLPPTRASTPPHFRFGSIQDDGESSDALPATISGPRRSNAASTSDEKDELDMISDGDEPRAGSSTARVKAFLDAAGPSTPRAQTRAPLHPITRSAQTAVPDDADVDYISSDGEEGAPPGKRMNTPNRTRLPGNVQQLKERYNNMGSDAAVAAAPPAPLKSQMQSKGPAQWGSVKGGVVSQVQAPEPQLDNKERLRTLGKIPKNKVATPADGDRIATSATAYVTPNTRPYASTSASTDSFDISQSPTDAAGPSSRPAPTPISRPSGSKDDTRYLRLRHCALGFKNLEITGSDRYFVGLTRDFKKLFVVDQKDDKQDVLVELNVSKGHIDDVTAVFQEKEITMPILQLKAGLSTVVKGSMSHYIDPQNAKWQEDVVMLVLETADPSWDRSFWETKFLKELRKAAGGMGRINNSGARQAWESVNMRCQLAERHDTHKTAEKDVSRRAPISRTLALADHGPRLPRERKKGNTVRNPSNQLTLSQSMGGSRRSARLSGTGANNATESRAAVPDADEVILVYPPSGRGSVNITNGDLGRLAPGDYLNDSLIEFGLKIWLNGLQKTQPDLAEQIHVFSSFFYKKLGSNVETGYQSVRKWTSKIDIFKKKYLVIPINENFHWYLAIVYEPARVLQTPPPSQTRQSTRLKGDKPDINLADSQVSAVEPQHVTESADAASTSAHATSHETDADADADAAQHTVGDMSEEMEVDNTLFGNGSPLSEPEEPDLLIPRSSSPEGHADVEMEDVSHEAGPSRAASSSADTLDNPSAAGDAPMHDDSIPPDVPQKSGRVTNGAVDASSFYAPQPPAVRANAKGKGRAKVPDYVDFESEDDDKVAEGVAAIDMTIEDDQPVAGDALPDPNAPPPAYIFTFDSLGGRHPGAGRKLGQYLHLEAHDKKGRDIASLSEWKYQVAHVPTQPNSCDCGVYLLHFAKQFAMNAEDIVTYITTKQGRHKGKSDVPDEHWDPASVSTARAELREVIEGESAIWKVARREQEEKERLEKEKGEKEKEEKEKEKKGEESEQAATGTGDGAAAAINIDSDSEVELVDAPPMPAKKTTRARTTYGKKNKR